MIFDAYDSHSRISVMLRKVQKMERGSKRQISERQKGNFDTTTKVAF
jgi:hypothetical protein